MDAKDIHVSSPIDVARRMPLAEAALTIWRFVFDEQHLQRLWDQHRGACYEKVISFSTMTHLVADALLLYGGSGRRSFEKNIESGQLQGSFQAAYGKLGRLPLELSEGLLREGTVALRKIFPPGAERSLPASVDGFEVLVVDGKAIKNVAKRLKSLRVVGGGLLGGKAIVALQWSTGWAVAMHTDPDGDASEKRLLKDLLPQTEGPVSKPRLFVGDRAYCNLVQMACFTEREGDHFLVRYQKGTTFTRDESRAAKTGTDSQGRTYQETWGWLGRVQHKGRRYARMIHLARPGEEEDLILVTDLLDEDAYPAIDLLWLYRERWGIERMFQKVTEVFGLESLIGGTPQACIFQFAFCLILYNLVQLLTNYIAQARKCEVEELSKEKLFDDLRHELIAWNVVFTPEQTIERFRDAMKAERLQSRLQELLGNAWSITWWKSPVQTNRKPSKREGKRGHGSVFRILQQIVEVRPKPKPKEPEQRC